MIETSGLLVLRVIRTVQSLVVVIADLDERVDVVLAGRTQPVVERVLGRRRIGQHPSPGQSVQIGVCERSRSSVRYEHCPKSKLTLIQDEGQVVLRELEPTLARHPPPKDGLIRLAARPSLIRLTYDIVLPGRALDGELELRDRCTAGVGPETGVGVRSRGAGVDLAEVIVGFEGRA